MREGDSDLRQQSVKFPLPVEVEWNEGGIVTQLTHDVMKEESHTVTAEAEQL
jgi:hypothetical protein